MLQATESSASAGYSQVIALARIQIEKVPGLNREQKRLFRRKCGVRTAGDLFNLMHGNAVVPCDLLQAGFAALGRLGLYQADGAETNADNIYELIAMLAYEHGEQESQSTIEVMLSALREEFETRHTSLVEELQVGWQAREGALSAQIRALEEHLRRGRRLDRMLRHQLNEATTLTGDFGTPLTIDDVNAWVIAERAGLEPQGEMKIDATLKLRLTKGLPSYTACRIRVPSDMLSKAILNHWCGSLEFVKLDQSAVKHMRLDGSLSPSIVGTILIRFTNEGTRTKLPTLAGKLRFMACRMPILRPYWRNQNRPQNVRRRNRHILVLGQLSAARHFLGGAIFLGITYFVDFSM